MDLHPSMSYRISTLEIEQAAIRAERARIAAEHADQIVHRDGILRRALRRLQGGRVARAAAGEPAAPVAPASAATPAVAPAAPFAPATDETRERELVGCVPHAA